MSVSVPSEDDIRRILREEIHAALASLSRSSDDRRVVRTEAAASAGVSPATITAWVEAGRLRRYGEGRNARYSLREVLALEPLQRPQALCIEDQAEAILRRNHG